MLSRVIRAITCILAAQQEKKRNEKSNWNWKQVRAGDKCWRNCILLELHYTINPLLNICWCLLVKQTWIKKFSCFRQARSLRYKSRIKATLQWRVKTGMLCWEIGNNLLGGAKRRGQMEMRKGEGQRESGDWKRFRSSWEMRVNWANSLLPGHSCKAETEGS